MSTAIVTGGTKKDVDAMAVLALNLREVSPELADELVIFHDGISAEKQELICRIMPTRFIKYRCPISRLRLISNKTIRYFSPMIFCKYECLRLLDEYDTVIWTDYDVVIRENIDELKSLSADMCCMVNEDKPLRSMFYPSIEKEDMSGYDLDGESVTTPLFVLRKSMQSYNRLYQWCYDKTKQYLKHLYLPEQCIITMMTQCFETKYMKLPIPVYCMHPRQAGPETKILHAYGQPKFWSGLHNEIWEQYFEEWKKMQARNIK